MKLLSIAFLLLITTQLVWADQNKLALKALEKGDFEEVEERLTKSLEKDVVNPGAKFIYSLLYVTDSFPRYNIDSAYYFVLKAITDFEFSDEKVLKELEKNEITQTDFESQKLKIEELAFQRAVEKNTILDYEYFIDHYTTASQVNQATSRRNQLAYDQIRAVNSWQAYASFIKDYPKAEQVPLAQREYERLLYQEHTDDGKLKSLENFLARYPDNEHRSKTEYKILKIKGGLNRPEDYLQFMESYPESKHNREVARRLFHIDRDFYDLKYFSDYAGTGSFRDSLQNVNDQKNSFLVPFYENSQYGFINSTGEIVLPPKYEYIKEDYLCGNILSDVLEVRENGKLQLVNHLGEPVYLGGFDVATDLGAGLVKLRKNGKYGIWHKAGIDILPATYDEIELLKHNLLKVRSGSLWGLFSVFGDELLAPQFDDVYLVDGYWVFEKDGLLAVVNLEYLEPLTDNESIILNFNYDEVELVKDKYLLCYSGDYESLINPDLDLIINSSDQTIIPMQDDWLVKRDSGYSYFYEENGSFLQDSFRDVSFSRGWFAFKRDSVWTLLSEGFGFEPQFQLDSARIWNDNIAYFQKEDAKHIAFFPQITITLDEEDDVRLLGTPQKQDSSQYLLVKNKNSHKVYSESGELKFTINYDDIDYLSQGYFSFEERRKKGILNEVGEVVLEPTFDAIGQVKDSLAPVLLKGEFGLYNLSSEFMIEPAYKKKLEKYGKRYLIGLGEDGYSFLDMAGEEMSEFSFTKIEYWNDEIALVRQDNVWSLFDIESDQTQLENIQSFEYMKNDEEKIAYILTDRGFGVYSNQRGEILPSSFNDIMNLGTVNKPLYFAEKHVPEAGFYLVVYADANGETLKSQAFRENEYEKIVCER